MRQFVIIVILFRIAEALDQAWDTSQLIAGMKESQEISSQCRTHLELYHEAMKFPTAPWAIKMIDADGSLEAGLLDGNVYALGSYSSCYDLVVDEVNGANGGFGGMYCTVQAIPMPKDGDDASVRTPFKLEPLSWPALRDTGLLGLFSVGICVPDSCSKNEVAMALAATLETEEFTYFPLMKTCEAKSMKKEITPGIIGFIATMGVFAVLLIIGTALEFRERKRNESRLLRGFSLYDNAKKLFSVKKRSGSGQIHCLNGMRFLSFTWVFIGHVYAFTTGTFPFSNRNDVIPGPTGFLFDVIRNALLSVDSFFFLSGTLLAFLTVKEMENLKRIKHGDIKAREWILFWVMFYVHRYLRLTLVLALIIFFHATVAFYVTNNQVQFFLELSLSWCRDNYGANLVYANNFWREDTMCLGQTWYLATEMQMFLLSPFLIYPLWRYKRLGWVVAAFWAVASVAVPMILTIVFDWPVDPNRSNNSGDVDWSEFNYYAPWCRSGPYVVGLIFGYIMYIIRDREIKLSWLTNIAGWLLAAGSGIAVVYGLGYTKWIEEGQEIARFPTALYAGFSRFTWGVCLAWVVFACTKGYGGYVDTLLSWKAFLPLSRVTYVGYLTHPSVIFVFLGYYRFTVLFTQFFEVMFAMACLVSTLIVSFIVAALFELPLLHMEKTVVTPQKAKQS